MSSIVKRFLKSSCPQFAKPVDNRNQFQQFLTRYVPRSHRSRQKCANSFVNAVQLSYKFPRKSIDLRKLNWTKNIKTALTLARRTPILSYPARGSRCFLATLTYSYERRRRIVEFQSNRFLQQTERRTATRKHIKWSCNPNKIVKNIRRELLSINMQDFVEGEPDDVLDA